MIGCSFIDVGCHHFIDIWIFGICFGKNYIVRSWMKLKYLHVFHGCFIMFLILRIRTFGVKKYLTKRPWCPRRSLIFRPDPSSSLLQPRLGLSGVERCPIREFNQKCNEKWCGILKTRYNNDKKQDATTTWRLKMLMIIIATSKI